MIPMGLITLAHHDVRHVTFALGSNVIGQPGKNGKNYSCSNIKLT